MKNYLLTLLLASVWTLSAFANDISGTVSNSKTGAPLPNIIVNLKNTTISTMTNSDGKYIINVPNQGGILAFFFKGKNIKEQIINTFTTINVAVETDEVMSGWKKGDWNMNIGGNINTHYVYTSTDASPAVVAGNALLHTGPSGAHSVQSGLLPTCLSFGANTVTKDSFTITSTISLFAGTVSNGGLAYSDLDLRQTFMTISKKSMGSFLIGRNFGIFGFDAIINDISLIGAGATAAPSNPLNTTLGGIGYGYVYCDRLSQINYTTTPVSGFDATIGIFNPINMASLGMASDAGETSSRRPGIHGKLKYASDMFYGSVSFISQDVKTKVSDFSSNGIDVYAKVMASGFSLAGYYYTGSGLGTTALLFDAADSKGVARSSSGYYAQAAYTFGVTKLGVNYGVSSINRTANDAATSLKQHQRVTLGLYRPITGSLNLIVELTNMQAQNHAGGTITNNAFNVGVHLGF
jgi:CarboxypepD_reg-like domain